MGCWSVLNLLTETDQSAAEDADNETQRRDNHHGPFIATLTAPSKPSGLGLHSAQLFACRFMSLLVWHKQSLVGRGGTCAYWCGSNESDLLTIVDLLSTIASEPFYFVLGLIDTGVAVFSLLEPCASVASPPWGRHLPLGSNLNSGSCCVLAFGPPSH